MSVLRRRIDQILETIWPGAISGQIPIYDGDEWVLGFPPWIPTLSSMGLIFVNASASPGGMGGPADPFKSIQTAINSILAGSSSTSIRKVYVVIISPGTYDEDVTINGSRRKIILYGVGPWNLGTFDNTNWQPSGTPRNITWTVTDTNIDDILPSLAICSAPEPGSAETPEWAYTSRPRISGNITLVNVTSVDAQVDISAEVYGNVDGSSYAGSLDLRMAESHVYGTVGGSKVLLSAERVLFDGAITVKSLPLARECQFLGNLDIQTNPSSPLIGHFSCFYGTSLVLGGTADYYLDSNSYYWYVAQGCSTATTINLVTSFPEATSVLSGLMSATDKNRFDYVSTGGTAGQVWTAVGGGGQADWGAGGGGGSGESTDLKGYKAGESILKGAGVYLKWDGVNLETRIYNACADSTGPLPFVIGLALSNYAVDDAAVARTAGETNVPITAWVNPPVLSTDVGQPVYLSDQVGVNKGKLCLTADLPTGVGDYIVRVGYVSLHSIAGADAKVVVLKHEETRKS